MTSIKSRKRLTARNIENTRVSTSNTEANKGLKMNMLNHFSRLPAYIYIAGQRALAVAGKKTFREQPKPTKLRVRR
jgi:hypothetical protein